jgi:hypothetical protein
MNIIIYLFPKVGHNNVSIQLIYQHWCGGTILRRGQNEQQNLENLISHFEVMCIAL